MAHGIIDSRGDGIDPSSRALLDELDERLVRCIPKEVENAHGVDYTVGLDELIKVSVLNDPLPSPIYVYYSNMCSL